MELATLEQLSCGSVQQTIEGLTCLGPVVYRVELVAVTLSDPGSSDLVGELIFYG